MGLMPVFQTEMNVETVCLVCDSDSEPTIGVFARGDDLAELMTCPLCGSSVEASAWDKTKAELLEFAEKQCSVQANNRPMSLTRTVLPFRIEIKLESPARPNGIPKQRAEKRWE